MIGRDKGGAASAGDFARSRNRSTQLLDENGERLFRRGERRTPRVLIYSHDTFGLGHLRRCRDDRACPGRAGRGHVGPDPVGLADHRQLRFPQPGGFRARARRHQAAQRRIHLAQPQIDARADAWRCAPRSSATRPRSSSPICSSSTRSRSACAAKSRKRLSLLKRSGTPLVLGLRDVMDEPELLAPEWERKNVVPALSRSLRRHLDLRPAADLRAAEGHRAARVGAAQDDLYRLPPAQPADQGSADPPTSKIRRRAVPAGDAGRRRRRRGAGRLGAARL